MQTFTGRVRDVVEEGVLWDLEVHSDKVHWLSFPSYSHLVYTLPKPGLEKPDQTDTSSLWGTAIPTHNGPGRARGRERGQ